MAGAAPLGRSEPDADLARAVRQLAPARALDRLEREEMARTPRRSRRRSSSTSRRRRLRPLSHGRHDHPGDEPRARAGAGRAHRRLRRARPRRGRRASAPSTTRPGRPDRPRARRRGARARRRARPPGDGGHGLRRVRGQGGQELHRHRVPVRLPQGQALGRGDRGGRGARRLLRRRADRGRARADADHEPDLDGALQGHRRRQDPQRDDLPAVGARRPLRAARRSSSCRRPARPSACRRTRCR